MAVHCYTARRLCALAPNRCDLPGSCNGAGRPSSPIWSCSAWGLPCQPDCFGRGALLPHHFTLTGPSFYRQTRRYIFCGTFRKDPFERSPPAVSRHVALWRPDFPPACASGYPSSTCQCSVSHDIPCDRALWLNSRDCRTTGISTSLMKEKLLVMPPEAGCVPNIDGRRPNRRAGITSRLFDSRADTVLNSGC